MFNKLSAVDGGSRPLFCLWLAEGIAADFIAGPNSLLNSVSAAHFAPSAPYELRDICGL
jgi:hypothetical protein